MHNVVKVLHLGKISYVAALKTQINIANEVTSSSPKSSQFKHHLILCEHQPVYTIGMRRNNYSLEDEHRLRNLGADYQITDRGGLITFHGPGQLVVYPILYLKHLKIGIRKYIHLLEQLVINTCKHYDVEATTTCDTGVWVKDKKICAIGIQGRRVTKHGIALNCCNDLSWFDHIVPCGIEGKGVTSLSQETNSIITPGKVEDVLLRNFQNIFQCEVIK